MKKLILIQNDYPGTGKSTLSLCLQRYLNEYGVEHRLLHLAEEGATPTPGATPLEADSLTPRQFLASVDSAPITIVEVASGLGEYFNQFYQSSELDTILYEAGVAVTVVLPVTADRESFDSVTQAAEVYSDNAEYLIAHLVTSSYDEDDKIWDTSYAARVMDMFEAVELHIPEITFHLELSLAHLDLDGALQAPNAEELLGKEYTKWNRRVMGQVDSARLYLFGDAFRPTIMPKSARPARKSRAKAAC
ncbi:MAG: hypothetical protein HS117_21575 [Verrucomicrobiaceae bacterium]|jgi:hypothetical protein|nr:hypothetical protein [Verrucomicrobiaceae bacterium]